MLISSKIDLLIANGWVLPMDDSFSCYSPGWIAIDSGRIAAVHAGNPPELLYQKAVRVIDAANSIVMPGLVNGHTHLAQTFMRGLAADQPLSTWLTHIIQPLQAAMTTEDMRLASLLGLVENLRSGVTAVVQHHKLTQSREHIEAALNAADHVGIRVLFARGWRDSGARGEAPEHIENELRYLHHHWHGRGAGRIRIASGPMEPRRCSSSTMRRMLSVARDLGIQTHMHVAETADEIAEFQQQNGMSQIEWLDNLRCLSPDVQLTHCVHVTDREMDIIGRRGAIVVHCPVSNMRLASGIAPIRKMLDRRIPVCLGTDGSASNDSQDLLETIKMASLLAKIATGDAGAITSRELLQMATVTGAEALGWPHAGRLAVGMHADVAVIDLNSVRAMPVHRPVNALIYCASGAQVHTLIVDGRILVDAHRVTILDEAALLAQCRDAAKRLLQRAGVVDVSTPITLNTLQHALTLRLGTANESRDENAPRLEVTA